MPIHCKLIIDQSLLSWDMARATINLLKREITVEHTYYLSKQYLFKRAWHILKVLSCPCPLSSNRFCLEVTKKVQYIHVTKRATKLWFTKLWGCPLILRKTVTSYLTSCNFSAPWDTETYCMFLETSKQILFWSIGIKGMTALLECARPS